MIRFQGFSLSNQSLAKKNQPPFGNEMKILQTHSHTIQIMFELLQTPIQCFAGTENNFETEFCCVSFSKVFSKVIQSWEIKTFNDFQFERQKGKNQKFQQ